MISFAWILGNEFAIFKTSIDVLIHNFLPPRHHGRSHNQIIDLLNYDHMADDVMSTINLLGLEHVHIIGHSMGGKVVASYFDPCKLHCFPYSCC